MGEDILCEQRLGNRNKGEEAEREDDLAVILLGLIFLGLRVVAHGCTTNCVATYVRDTAGWLSGKRDLSPTTTTAAKLAGRSLRRGKRRDVWVFLIAKHAYAVK